MDNKGFVKELSVLPLVIILFVVAAVVASFGQTLLGDTRDDIAQDDCVVGSYWWNATDETCRNVSTSPNEEIPPVSLAYNSTVSGQEGIDEITSKFDTLGLTVAIFLVLAIIMGVFVFFKFGRR